MELRVSTAYAQISCNTRFRELAFYAHVIKYQTHSPLIDIGEKNRFAYNFYLLKINGHLTSHLAFAGNVIIFLNRLKDHSLLSF